MKTASKFADKCKTYENEIEYFFERKYFDIVLARTILQVKRL